MNQMWRRYRNIAACLWRQETSLAEPGANAQEHCEIGPHDPPDVHRECKKDELQDRDADGYPQLAVKRTGIGGELTRRPNEERTDNAEHEKAHADIARAQRLHQPEGIDAGDHMARTHPVFAAGAEHPGIAKIVTDPVPDLQAIEARLRIQSAELNQRLDRLVDREQNHDEGVKADHGKQGPAPAKPPEKTVERNRAREDAEAEHWTRRQRKERPHQAHAEPEEACLGRLQHVEEEWRGNREKGAIKDRVLERYADADEPHPILRGDVQASGGVEYLRGELGYGVAVGRFLDQAEEHQSYRYHQQHFDELFQPGRGPEKAPCRQVGTHKFEDQRGLDAEDCLDARRHHDGQGHPARHDRHEEIGHDGDIAATCDLPAEQDDAWNKEGEERRPKRGKSHANPYRRFSRTKKAEQKQKSEPEREAAIEAELNLTATKRTSGISRNPPLRDCLRSKNRFGHPSASPRSLTVKTQTPRPDCDQPSRLSGAARLLESGHLPRRFRMPRLLSLTTASAAQCHRALQQNCGSTWLNADPDEAPFFSIRLGIPVAASFDEGYPGAEPRPTHCGCNPAPGARRPDSRHRLRTFNRNWTIEERQ